MFFFWKLEGNKQELRLSVLGEIQGLKQTAGKFPTTAARFNMPELVFVFVYMFKVKYHPAGNVIPLTTQFLRDPFDDVYTWMIVKGRVKSN